MHLSVAVQVVAFQATMQMMADQFPGAFAGYSLEVEESHQRSKVDTSGTAKAIVGSFRQLGIDFSDVSISPDLCPTKLHVPVRPSRTAACQVADN